MEPKEFTPLTPKVVLGIAAHPDDLDFGAAGTMAKFAREGAQIHYLILTDGSKGSADMTIQSEKLIEIREQEQREALKILGGQPQNVQFLHKPDGMLEITMDLKKEIVKVIRAVKPDIVVTMDPSMIYSAARGFINHPDHRAAGQAALDAVFPLARDHLSFPDLYAAGYLPHKTAHLLLINFDVHNFFMDISETMDAKLAAIAAHKSQVPELAATQERFKQLATTLGAKTGSQYAEAFMRIDITG